MQNDEKWLERIKIGMVRLHLCCVENTVVHGCSQSLQRDIGGFKFGLFTGNGAAVGWNADTAHLVDEGGEGLGSYVAGSNRLQCLLIVLQ